MADKEIQQSAKTKLIQQLKPFFYLQAVFGFDYGLFGQNDPCTRRSIKVVSTCIVLFLLCSLTVFDYIYRPLDWYLMYPLQYGVDALLTIYKYGPKLRKNFKRYDEIDEKLKIEDKYYKYLKIWMCVYMFGFLLLNFSYIGSITSRHGIQMTCSFIFVVDISFIFRLLFLDLILYRIKRLRIFIEIYHNDDLKITAAGKKPLCIDSTLHMPLYKSLADQLDDFYNCLGFLFTLTFVLSLSKFVIILYDVTTIQSDTEKSDIYFMIMSISLAVHTVLNLGAPGYLGERILTEVGKIKLSLANELIKNYGLEKKNNIGNFLEYISLRPMSLTAFGAIPVNVKLISLVANFCTCIIVLLWQFPISPILSLNPLDHRINIKA